MYLIAIHYLFAKYFFVHSIEIDLIMEAARLQPLISVGHVKVTNHSTLTLFRPHSVETLALVSLQIPLNIYSM